MQRELAVNEKRLSPYVSKLGAFSLSLGTSIGWGSFVVTSNNYLLQAGPLGSILGLVVGAVIMIIISRNYHYMINCFPDAGGAYSFAKETFGYDHGFLTGWFLILTYISVLWANATSLPLFSRIFVGDIFHFGKMYTLFGYDVYIGETLLSIAGIFLISLLCMRFKKAIQISMIVMVLLFSAGIVICFIAAMFGRSTAGISIDPAFLPDKTALTQLITIATISPWAFIGFENISHMTEEFKFQRNKTFRILTISVVATTLLYVFVFLLSTSAYPEQYGSWLEYLKDLNNLEGIEALPPFYAAHYYLGNFGVVALILSLLSLVLTSLIGNITALSRLFYSMAKDSVIPERFSKLNKRQIPRNAIFLIAVLSIPIPFLGRTAIGWIVDVTTIGATIIYGFVSASALKIARQRKDTPEKVTGLLGLILMILFAAYLLLPNLFASGSMEKETYFLFVIWGILGFLFFRSILKRDKLRRFGRSIIVWLALLSMVLFISLIWMSQSMMSASNEAMEHISEYYHEELNLDESVITKDEAYVESQMEALRRSNTVTTLAVTALAAISIFGLIANFTYMNKRARESEEQLGIIKDLANKDPLTGVKSKHAYAENEMDLNSRIKEGSAETFAVVVCDVNGLKYVNDTFGHKAGDEYICSASRMICDIFQHSPVFRVGGDEFVVFLAGRDFEHREDLLREIHDRSVKNIPEKKVVVAAGYSDYISGQDRDVHAVFERADAKMYQEKQNLKGLGSVSR